MTQRPIFPPASHRNDPATSHEAEAAVTKSGQRATHALLVLRELKANPAGLTAPEIAAMLRLEIYQVRRRLTDLKDAGLVERTDRVRVWGKTGRGQCVWRVS